MGKITIISALGLAIWAQPGWAVGREPSETAGVAVDPAGMAAADAVEAARKTLEELQLEIPRDGVVPDAVETPVVKRINTEQWAYPPESYLAKEEGMVGVSLTLGDDRAITNCRVVTSSGFPRLDAVTCPAVIRKDAAQSRSYWGSEMAGEEALARVAWRIREPRVRADFHLIVSAQVNAKGKQTGCEVLRAEGALPESFAEPCDEAIHGRGMVFRDGNGYPVSKIITFDIKARVESPPNVQTDLAIASPINARGEAATEAVDGTPPAVPKVADAPTQGMIPIPYTPYTDPDFVAEQWAYPPESYLAKEEGMVGVSLTLGDDRAITNCRVVTSSGFPRLDSATCPAIIEEGAAQSWGNEKVGEEVAAHVEWRIHEPDLADLHLVVSTQVDARGEQTFCEVLRAEGALPEPREKFCDRAFHGEGRVFRDEKGHPVPKTIAFDARMRVEDPQSAKIER